MAQIQSYQGETAAVIFVGILFGLLVLAFGIRACYQMTGLCFRRTRNVESQQPSTVVDHEKGLVSARTINHDGVSRVPAILVKLRCIILRGYRTSVRTTRPALIGQVHPTFDSEERQSTLPNETPDEDRPRNAPGTIRSLPLHVEFKFPHIQTVPRRPSVSPPDDVYRVLERAESWWFPSPTSMSTLTATAQSGYSEQQQNGPTKTITKKARQHQRCCPLLGSQRTSAPTLVVLITPPTPPKSVPESQAPECLNSPGLHPTLGSISSPRKTPPMIPDGLVQRSSEGDGSPNKF